MSLPDLPSEVHHEIFSFLDYVRDVCAHPLLFVPTICMPSTREEFDQMILSDDRLEFDEKPISGGLLIVCKSILQSVRSFKPNILNFTTFNSITRCKFPLDWDYSQLLNKYEWLREKPKDLPKAVEWMDMFHTFNRKLKKLCHGNPFCKVEFVSFSTHIGKNYRVPYYSYLFTKDDFHEFTNLVPSVRHYHLNFNAELDVKLLNSKLPSTNITIIKPYGGENKTIFSKSENVFWNRDYEWEHYNSTPITELVNAQPRNFQRNVESLLFSFILTLNYSDAQYIIDNFKIDIDNFSHIWNIQCSDIKQVLKSNNLHDIMSILQKIYTKYPTFRVFKIPIYDMDCLKIIKSYEFIDINVGRNITKCFLDSIIDKEEVISFCHEHNVDISRLGKYQFSVASFFPDCFTRSKIKLDPNSKDNFGITPCMLLHNTNKTADMTIRDNFGNNILHYFFKKSYTERWSFQSFRDIPILQNVSDDELKRLTEQQNIFGITPKELAFSNRCRMNLDNFSKIFNYKAYELYCDRFRQSLLFLDGLQVDMRILFASANEMPFIYSYEEYKDINYRDINGKHFVHYCENALSDTIVDTLKLPFKDIVFCKDNNCTVPLQTSNLEYYQILDKMRRFDLPKFNFISYTNNFGMYRMMYLMASNLFNNSVLIPECNTIAFDYANGQAQLISLHSHSSNWEHHFSLETSSLEQLRNISYFGTVDGDDISHFVVRLHLDCIKKRSVYMDYSLLNALIRRGLKFNIVRNSQGKTAYDLFDEFTGLSGEKRTEIASLKRTCKRGLKTKSRALNKFTIKHNNLPPECIKEITENSLIITCEQIYRYRIRVHRSLFFERIEKVVQL